MINNVYPNIFANPKDTHIRNIKIVNKDSFKDTIPTYHVKESYANLLGFLNLNKRYNNIIGRNDFSLEINMPFNMSDYLFFLDILDKMQIEHPSDLKKIDDYLKGKKDSKIEKLELDLFTVYILIINYMYQNLPLDAKKQLIRKSEKKEESELELKDFYRIYDSNKIFRNPFYVKNTESPYFESMESDLMMLFVYLYLMFFMFYKAYKLSELTEITYVLSNFNELNKFLYLFLCNYNYKEKFHDDKSLKASKINDSYEGYNYSINISFDIRNEFKKVRYI